MSSGSQGSCVTEPEPKSGSLIIWGAQESEFSKEFRAQELMKWSKDLENEIQEHFDKFISYAETG